MYTANISIGINTGSNAECDNSTGANNASVMANAIFRKVQNANLSRGNNSANDDVTGQEKIYACLLQAGDEITAQSYSTANQGAWTIRILMVAISLGGRKPRKKEKDKLLQALHLITDELQEKHALNKSEVMDLVVRELQKKYKISQKETLEIIDSKQQEVVPITLFTKELGGLEALVKYLKENRNFSYATIAEMLQRDERTIWTAYNKAITKKPTPEKIAETMIHIPLEIFKQRKLTILEAIVHYLHEIKNMKFSEIGRLLERDERNVWTIHSRAMKK